MTSSDVMRLPPRAERRFAGLTKRAQVAWLFVLAALCGGFVWRYAMDPRWEVPASFEGATMGTTYSVKLGVSGISEREHARLAEDIDVALERINALMSTYRPDSELSRFNRWRSKQPFRVSEETFEVVLLAQRVSALTEGAFDITVAPLVAAWGFGAHAAAEGPPTPQELDALRARVGYRQLELDLERRTLRKLHPEVTCDLSAIAKGHAVDELARVLQERGYRDYLVEVGGELRARGNNRNGEAWLVGIETPAKRLREVGVALRLTDRALATSGSYRNFHQRYGRELSHTIDPRTGRPVEHTLASVSVLHDQTAMADALATAFQVLGAHAGYRLAIREGLAVRFVSRAHSGGFQELTTPAFTALTKRGSP